MLTARRLPAPLRSLAALRLRSPRLPAAQSAALPARATCWRARRPGPGRTCAGALELATDGDQGARGRDLGRAPGGRPGHRRASTLTWDLGAAYAAVGRSGSRPTPTTRTPCGARSTGSASPSWGTSIRSPATGCAGAPLDLRRRAGALPPLRRGRGRQRLFALRDPGLLPDAHALPARRCRWAAPRPRHRRAQHLHLLERRDQRALGAGAGRCWGWACCSGGSCLHRQGRPEAYRRLRNRAAGGPGRARAP